MKKSPAKVKAGPGVDVKVKRKRLILKKVLSLTQEVKLLKYIEKMDL